MAVERAYDTLTVVASQDLTGHQFKAVDLSGGVGVTSLLSVGILRTKAFTGDHATVAYKGQMKGISGAAINSGAHVGVTTSGFLISVASTTNVGLCLATAGSGDVFPFVGNFIADGAA
ncbi:MAG: capsid cement protein [Candidatus Bathyarchaeia archaeon]